MDKVAEILASAKGLTPSELQRLLKGLGAIDANTEAPASRDDTGTEKNAIQMLLNLAGSTTSEHSDLSTNKYKHVAAAANAER